MKSMLPLRTIASRALQSASRDLLIPRYGLAAIMLTYLLLALTQSALLPTFEGPDEQRHYAYARYLVNNHTLPPVYKEPNDDSWTYQVAQESGQPPLYYLMVALVTAPLPGADQVAAFVHPNPFMTAYDVTGIGNDNHNRYLHGSERYSPFEGASLAVHAGRLVSVLLGLLTLAGVYGAARAVVPTQPAVGLLATALVAYQPVFLFLSSAITNDAAVICFATLATWMALRIAREGATAKLVILASVFSGLTLLSKFNGVWIAGVVWLAIAGAQCIHARRTSSRLRLTPLVISVALWALVVGWWFVRNDLVAGEPFGLAIHAIGDQSPLRLGKSALVNFGLRLAELESSTWFSAGWAALVPGPDWIYTTYRLVFGIGALGALFAAVQALSAARPGARFGALRRVDAVMALQGLCLALCLLFASLGAIYWILVYMWSIGRLMFPAVASAGVLGAIGWTWWLRWLGSMRLRFRVRELAAAVLVACLLCGSIGGVGTAMIALNTHPGITPMTDQMSKTQLTFLEPNGQHKPVASVIGYEFVAQDIRPGGALYGKVCWKSEGYVQHDYPYSVQLVGDGDVRPATRNSFHGLGSYPLSAWKPGQTFCDPTSLLVTSNVDRPRAYKLLVSLFDDTQPAGDALPVIDANGNATYPVIARVRVAPAISRPLVPAATVMIGDFAGLLGTRIDAHTQAGAGTILSVTVRWAAQKSTTVDAKVFMHILDKTGKVVAQSDHQPDAGWFPTDYWQAGDMIEDHFEITLPAGSGLNDLRVGLGMYDASSLQRLPAAEVPAGTRLQDDMVIVRQ